MRWLFYFISYSEYMSPFVLIAIFLALGFAFQRFIPNREAVALKLNQFVIYVILPAIIVRSIPKMQIDLQLLYPMLACWLVVITSSVLIYYLAKFKQWPAEVTGCLLLVAVLGNTSYWGFPVIKSLYGDAGLSYAIIYDQLGNFVALATYGTVVAVLYQKLAQHQLQSIDAENIEEEVRLELKDLLMRVLLFPPFMFLVLSLASKVFLEAQLLALVELLEPVLGWISYGLIPFTMFIVGLQFQVKLAEEYRSPMLWGIGLKLLVGPVVVIGLGFFFNNEALVSKVVLMEAGMPAMVTAGALAMSHNLAPKLAASIVGFGLMVSVVWSGVLYWLAENLY